MMLMLCKRGTVSTCTVTGRIYECVGRFVCPECGFVSEILEFDAPVAEWSEIDCFACGTLVERSARYAHQDRFTRLTSGAPLLEHEADRGSLLSPQI